ncbi:MAG: 16S rRNA (cytidine(1402)-2'-O)-methyltransferase [Bacilli bacterium]|jgi:16S rRNA (cytidine1402-2'-O)-methyltransferase|nr:16S rRNA (cytidine(1402)-2'-O)-methyltransferase [Bacilli bacterium]
MSQKSYFEKVALYLVPTPIGNLDDITIRALEVLKKVDVIFSEDTRTTKILLNHYNIINKTISYHKYNEKNSSENILKYLENGSSVAVVSDRGAPLISDPGEICVRKAIEKNFAVISLPGPNAILPAITSSGFSCDKFVFFGFLDSKISKKRNELIEIERNEYTTVIYESPHRIIETLNLINEIFKERQICLAREISKKHEEIYRGTAKEILDEENITKGEIVIVISGEKKSNNYENLSIIEHVNLYLKEGKEKNEAIKLVAKDRKVTKNLIYSEYLKKGK